MCVYSSSEYAFLIIYCMQAYLVTTNLFEGALKAL